ncbi:hypothetical protein J6Y73_03230 [bacterium]|nr:hypothetical protein [bacterium]
MILVRRINPIEIDFMSWIKSSPESCHPLDMKRFYIFVDDVLLYKKTSGKKWFNKDYFISQCKKHNTRLNEEIIEKYWAMFETIKHYNQHRGQYGMKIMQLDDECLKYRLDMYLNGSLKTITINEEIYRKKWISKEYFIELLNKKEDK